MNTCTIEGCGTEVRYKTLRMCQKHYLRQKRYGDPLGGRTPNGEPERYFREVVMAYEGDECLLWPYAKNERGYAVLQRGNRAKRLQRLICEERHGPPPTRKHEAAHSCGRGEDGCVTKRHLDWKTSKENKADMLVHGTRPFGERNGSSRFTEAQVLRIFSLKGKMLQREIAALEGVRQWDVSSIHRGRTWGWLTGATA
jgi:hypothetical protein